MPGGTLAGQRVFARRYPRQGGRRVLGSLSLFHSTAFVVAQDLVLFCAVLFWLGCAFWTHRDASGGSTIPCLSGRRRSSASSRSAARSCTSSSARRRPAPTPGVAGSSSGPRSSLDRREPRCPVCRTAVEPAFLVCPVCTTHLKEPCRACEAPLELALAGLSVLHDARQGPWGGRSRRGPDSRSGLEWQQKGASEAPAPRRRLLAAVSPRCRTGTGARPRFEADARIRTVDPFITS